MSKILFLPPESKEDSSFIEKCYKKIDYRRNINVGEMDVSDIFIINNGSKNIGIFSPNILEVTNLIHSRPIIYLLKEYRIHSSNAICEMIFYLFEVRNVDRIIIQVYSDNIQMVNCMKNLKIPMRGSVKDIRIFEGKLMSILFFDISLERYINLKDDFIE
ncbi:hypothetical protein ACXOM1_08970 [Streptococcus thermophilus]|nr:hypothetical protein [Streptococcus thermophilus]MCE2064481.1 hypothetical protein [Streptococcus thermophilus]MCE2066247.1 hypothetical protein [Streptococcus thermophilus]MCE2072991.1 hypothetical protein [Streptococcus thermophilus]MCE2077904.1 hypothetical protein [Streptococcus thermophilus]